MTVGEGKRMRRDNKGANEEGEKKDDNDRTHCESVAAARGTSSGSVEAAHLQTVQNAEQESSDAREQKIEKTPKAPTREEYEVHRLTHDPYHNLCPHCVRAKRKNPPHFRDKSGKEHSAPIISLD